jgi:excisionase family DNA binding protein
MSHKNLTLADEEMAAFSLEQLAALFAVSVGFLRLEVARGNLRAARLGPRRMVRISRSEVRRYFDEASRPPAKAAAQ